RSPRVARAPARCGGHVRADPADSRRVSRTGIEDPRRSLVWVLAVGCRQRDAPRARPDASTTTGHAWTLPMARRASGAQARVGLRHSPLWLARAPTVHRTALRRRGPAFRVRVTRVLRSPWRTRPRQKRQSHDRARAPAL